MTTISFRDYPEDCFENKIYDFNAKKEAITWLRDTYLPFLKEKNAETINMDILNFNEESMFLGNGVLKKVYFVSGLYEKSFYILITENNE